MAKETQSGAEAPVIRISHLSKMYRLYNKPSDRLREEFFSHGKKYSKELYALKDVSFTVRKGETVGIIGTNGSGKSTILKIITGVLTPTSGEVEVNGRISALLELGAGFNQEYTGIENIYLNGTMMGFSKEEIEARMEEILRFADIGDFVNQPVKTYSSGMFVRLAFALAINIDPEILIVDEALSVGDVFFQAKCFHKFEEFREQGKTILFVSHDLSSIAKYCDRVILLNKGDKVSEGEPKPVVDLYKQLLVSHEEEEQSAGEAAPQDSRPEEEKGRKPLDESITGPLLMNPSTLEYGEMQAKIVRITLRDHNGQETNTLEKGMPCSISVRVRFQKTVQDPIIAFTIKNVHGTELTGTNTMYEGVPLGEKQPGEETEVTFTQDMNLQGGEYLLSFGCTGYHEGDFRVFHRLYDVIGITVISSKNTVGFFDMGSSVSVS